MRSTPLVSIIIPTFNRSDLMQRALKSVFNQTYSNIEIIVIDDCSTDNTQQVLKEYKDNRLIILKNDFTLGACKARNRGIFKAKGEFITFLDDDDEFFPERIEKMLNFWDDRWAYITTGRVYVTKLKRKTYLPKEIITLDDLLFEITIGNSVLTKTERVVQLQGFDENLYSSQDYDLWIRLNQKFGNGYCIQEPLFVMHTEHEKPRISTSEKKLQGHFDFYKKHKAIMSYDQRRSKIFELVKYRGKKIGLIKLIKLGKNRKKSEILKVYLNSRFPWVKTFLVKFL